MNDKFAVGDMVTNEIPIVATRLGGGDATIERGQVGTVTTVLGDGVYVVFKHYSSVPAVRLYNDNVSLYAKALPAQGKRTQREIDLLVAQWAADPTRPLELADGFEEHREELRGIRLLYENGWARERHNREMEKAAELGVPGNTLLASYVFSLEQRLQQLERLTMNMAFPG